MQQKITVFLSIQDSIFPNNMTWQISLPIKKKFFFFDWYVLTFLQEANFLTWIFPTEIKVDYFYHIPQIPDRMAIF